MAPLGFSILPGQIEHAQGEVRNLTVALDHVEEIIRLSAPDIGIQAIVPRCVPPAHHAFRGEVSRTIPETSGGRIKASQSR